MELTFSHRTGYKHQEGVDYGLLELRKRPLTNQVQSVASWHIEISGGRHELDFKDHNGNHVALISYDKDSNALEIATEGRVVTRETHGVYGQHDGIAPLWYYQRSTALTTAGPEVRRLAKGFDQWAGDELDRLHALADEIRAGVAYNTGRTDTSTGAEAALESGHGVCQDHAHIMLAACRLLGFPARYVGGHLLTPEEEYQEAGHAWAEIHVPDLGWVGFDVSNGVSPDERYIRVSTGLDYAEAAPVTGMRYGAGEQSMAVTVQVQQ
jgi:transglutaminase-like putative cysteine protease